MINAGIIASLILNVVALEDTDQLLQDSAAQVQLQQCARTTNSKL